MTSRPLLYHVTSAQMCSSLDAKVRCQLLHPIDIIMQRDEPMIAKFAQAATISLRHEVNINVLKFTTLLCFCNHSAPVFGR
mmetsp:Transcript_41193/g.68516  ORF Transcript_41193/g.68516 Transcript_41193/m.68516 type:complete len:81 (-) Transcript_41193:956-1198(-)